MRYELDIIYLLDLSCLGIIGLGELGKCINIIILDLAHNELQSIVGIETLINLNRLDLSYNKLADISQLQNLLKLEYLNLQKNEIKKYSDLDPIKKLPLKHLKLQEFGGCNANTICASKDYRETIITMIPSLISLDNHRKNTPFITIDKKIKEIYDRESNFIAQNEDFLNNREDFDWINEEEVKLHAEGTIESNKIINEIHNIINEAKSNLEKFNFS